MGPNTYSRVFNYAKNRLFILLLEVLKKFEPFLEMKTDLNHWWKAIVVGVVLFIISGWQAERQSKADLATAIEQLKRDDQPLSARNIQEEMDAIAKERADNQTDRELNPLP